MSAYYICEWNGESKLWQITSPSGHVLYESPREAEVQAVCESIRRRLSGEIALEAMMA